MSPKLIIPIVIVVIVAILLAQSVFTVDETEQAIVTQLGKYVKTASEPGLHFKIPFVQMTKKFEKRVMEYDSKPAKMITSDKKQLVIDNYARWRIVDPLKFYEKVRSEQSAIDRLDDIVFSEIREEIARHTLTEIVTANRDELMQKVTEQCRAKASEYGIEIIDVRVKRADLPREVAPSVYTRMIAERDMIAKKYRAEGAEEAAKIMAETDMEKTILLAESYRKAEILKGEGDAKAIKIYAEAFEQDPEFYAFVKTLETYEKALKKDTTIILPANSEFFKYLNTK
ncbi:MAG: protease modulator HflC [Planctomycetes bacterium]|nr:protease modulator HflC [Planctomycetota bacterium]